MRLFGAQDLGFPQIPIKDLGPMASELGLRLQDVVELEDPLSGSRGLSPLT